MKVFVITAAAATIFAGSAIAQTTQGGNQPQAPRNLQ